MTIREPKPVFWDYLRAQDGRDDAVGALARLATEAGFAGATTCDIWDHLEELGVMDESGEAMQKAEWEYNDLVLEWEDRMRSQHRHQVWPVMRGALPSLGRWP